MVKLISKITGLLVVILIAIVTYFFFFHKKIDKVIISEDMVVQQVEQLGRLEVVKYTIRDIVEYERVRQLLPNSKTALIVTGEIIGCVDLTKIEKKDIFCKGDSVSILLPAPEVASFKIDHSKSKVYNVDYGLWETSDLVDQAYSYAEKQLFARAKEMGLDNDGRENTIRILKPLFVLLGFNKINIQFKASPAPQSMVPKDAKKLIINR